MGYLPNTARSVVRKSQKRSFYTFVTSSKSLLSHGYQDHQAQTGKCLVISHYLIFLASTSREVAISVVAKGDAREVGVRELELFQICQSTSLPGLSVNFFR